MTPRTDSAGNRRGIRRVAAFACVSLALGCGGRSGKDQRAPADSPMSGAGAPGEAGGTRGGSGDTGGGSGTPAEAGRDVGNGEGGQAGADAGATQAGGMAGNTAGAGAAGMGGISGDDDDEACVNVSGAGNEPWFDLTVGGTEFDAEEGEHVRIVVATQSGNRVGVADVPVVGGAFMVSLPEVLNLGYYVGVTLYIDRNSNLTCETDEHVWDWTTRAVVADMRFDVTPDELCDDSLMSCRPWKPTVQACWVGSGDTDLTAPLPCIP